MTKDKFPRDVRLVVGLGNPGSRYERNRHNVGYLTIDSLLSHNNARLSGHKNIAQVARVRLGVLPGGVPGPLVILAKMGSYMNECGRPLAALMKYFDISPDELLVIHDDLDLCEHRLRLKFGGGEGGHNGLKSISSSLGTRDYMRLRIGIGRPPGRMDPAAYVLADLRPVSQWDITLHEASEAVESVVSNGFITAQQQLHSG